MSERSSDVRRASRERGGAGERLLTIGGHDRRSCRSAECGIALACPMLVNKSDAASLILAGTPWLGVDQHFDKARRPHPEQTKAQETAELVHARVAHPSPTPCSMHGKPDLVAGSRSIYTLQHQLKTEGELELADHHDRRLVSAERDQIAAADFALDREAEPFEIALHGCVERRLRGFQVAFPVAWHPSKLPRFGKRRVMCSHIPTRICSRLQVNSYIGLALPNGKPRRIMPAVSSRFHKGAEVTSARSAGNTGELVAAREEAATGWAFD